VVKRQRPHARIMHDKGLIARLREIKADHPFWGYRRLWAHLRFVDQILVNKKRIRRLVCENNLGVSANTRLRAKRTPQRSKPRPNVPNQWWGIDMTKVMTRSGHAYVVLVLDWYTKKLVGHYVGVQSKAEHWLEALERAVQRQCPNGSRDCNISLMSDNGCQPTSAAFMARCRRLGIQQAFTSYNNPKGNADTERMVRTMKEELLWLYDWGSSDDVAKALDAWAEKYNNQYLHSTLKYKTPCSVEQLFFQQHETPLMVA